MKFLKYFFILFSPVWAQPLPSIEHMLAEKNWYFSTAVHPETHMIYARVNLGDADLWRKTIFPKPEVIRDKTNADAEKLTTSQLPAKLASTAAARRKIEVFMRLCPEGMNESMKERMNSLSVTFSKDRGE